MIHTKRYANVVMTPLSKQYQNDNRKLCLLSPFPPETLHTQKKEGDNKLLCRLDRINNIGIHLEISKADPSYTEWLTGGLKNAYSTIFGYFFNIKLMLLLVNLVIIRLL